MHVKVPPGDRGHVSRGSAGNSKKTERPKGRSRSAWKRGCVRRIGGSPCTVGPDFRPSLRSTSHFLELGVFYFPLPKDGVRAAVS